MDGRIQDQVLGIYLANLYELAMDILYLFVGNMQESAVIQSTSSINEKHYTRR